MNERSVPSVLVRVCEVWVDESWCEVWADES